MYKFNLSYFLSFLSFLQFNSCTAFGLLVGLSSDASHMSEFNQTTLEIHNLDQGRSMELNLANGDPLKGKFFRLESVVVDEYKVRYVKYRQLVLRKFTIPQLYN
jgi:hypothetical protein